MDEEKENVTEIGGEFLDVTGKYYGRNGRNDYSRKGIEIDTVVDAEGNALSLTWDESWTPVSPGIEIGIIDDKRTLRIYRNACPVRVRFRHYSEYVSYDCGDHNEYWESFYWVRYVDHA